jgi:hypothetical protein
MTNEKFIWAALFHMGYNMWSDVPVPFWGPKNNCVRDPEQLKWICAADHLRFDESVWRKATAHAAERGMNMLVIDIGEALQLQSHPELAVKGSWTIERFRKELARLRGMGLEPIPKLNFSTSHDTWLKEYHRMISTPEYYKVCADVIREVWEIFDKPRLFHLGYDEETMGNQYVYGFAVVRQGELWWHDFLFFVDTVNKQNVRPWIWSDYCWNHKEAFLQRMPKCVLQSNWYYGASFDPEKSNYVQTYLDLDKAGFDQVPTGSNWSNDTNFGGTVEFCTKNLSKEHLKGFLQTPWHPTVEKDLEHHLKAIAQVKAAKDALK